jgi:double-strand break repair protein MRE11
MPEESILASLSIDTVKVSKLVREFLNAQSLKILPQAPFGDAVSQFVDKDDKHAMQVFVDQSLEGQVQTLLSLEDDEEDLDSAMARYAAQVDKQFQEGTLARRSRASRKLKPRPEMWDSDMDGEWEDQPGAWEHDDKEDAAEPETVAPTRRRGKVASPIVEDDDDDFNTPAPAPAPAKRAPAKRAAPATRKPTAPKKTPAPKKAPAKAKVNTGMFVDDDDDDEDIIMLDEPPVPKSQPKRAAATRSRPATQTQLNFSQASSQVVGRGKGKAKAELSDDEISDDDDAFEPVASTRSSRRR